MTFTTASTQTPSNAPAIRPGQSTPQRQTQESPADKQRMKDAFDKQLQSLDSESDGTADLDGTGETAAAFTPIGGHGQRDGNGAGMAHTAAAGLDMAQQAQLDRMAAAIAEVRDMKLHTQYSINFASGTAPVEGALLSLNQNGALLVQLVGPASGMLPGERQQLARDLEERLKRRKIALQAVRYASPG